jgi:hypothetical protein
MPEHAPPKPDTPPPHVQWSEEPSAEGPGFRFTRTERGTLEVFSGLCPRCDHDMEWQIERQGFASPTWKRETIGATFTMYCKCGFNHEGRPADRTGCGAYWRHVRE